MRLAVPYSEVVFSIGLAVMYGTYSSTEKKTIFVGRARHCSIYRLYRYALFVLSPASYTSMLNISFGFGVKLAYCLCVQRSGITIFFSLCVPMRTLSVHLFCNSEDNVFR